MIDLLMGNAVLIVGVEPDDEDPTMTRVYLGTRSRWVYVLVSGDDAERVKSAWGGSARHLTMPKPPPDAPIYQDPRGFPAEVPS